MTEYAELVRWGLATVFAAGAVGKLRDPGRAAEAIFRFGLTARPRYALGAGLGAVELGVAAAYAAGGVADNAAAASAVPGAVVLWTFAAVLTASVRRGADFPCACFLADEPISIRTAARTGLLAVAATAVVAASNGAPDAGAAAVHAVGGAAVVGCIVLAAKTARLAAVSSFRGVVE